MSRQQETSVASQGPARAARRGGGRGGARMFDARLLVVTGKGGTGKTTVAAAMATAAAATGREVLLVEVEGRQGLARLFDLPALAHEESPLADRIAGTALEPRAALREYLDRAGVPVLGGLLELSGAADLVTAATPGLGDALLVEKVWELATRAGEDGRPGYDLVVLDAPPTGRIVPFLRAPATIAGLARFGPVADRAGAVAHLLADPAQTRIVLTTLAEALPVTETLEAGAALAQAGFTLGAVVANQVLPDLLGTDAARLPRAADDVSGLAAAAAAGGLALRPADLKALVAEATDQQRLVDTQRRLVGRLRTELGVDVVELPLLVDGVDGHAAVSKLARPLRRLGTRARRRAGVA